VTFKGHSSLGRKRLPKKEDAREMKVGCSGLFVCKGGLGGLHGRLSRDINTRVGKCKKYIRFERQYKGIQSMYGIFTWLKRQRRTMPS
jgi:hypothetical protein